MAAKRIPRLNANGQIQTAVSVYDVNVTRKKFHKYFLKLVKTYRLSRDIIDIRGN